MADDASSTTAPSRRTLFGLAIGAGLASSAESASSATSSAWTDIEAELAVLHPKWHRRIRLCSARQDLASDAFDAEGREGGFARLLELEQRCGVNDDDCDYDQVAGRICDIARLVASSPEMAPAALRVRTILAVINHHQIDKESFEITSLVLLLAESSGVADLPWLAEEVDALRRHLAENLDDASGEAVAA